MANGTIDYKIGLVTLQGEKKMLAEWRDQVLLVVNVASKCGFTPQYAGLEALHRRFDPEGFAVLGFPCNQFAGQEPGDAAAIASFCALTYDVTFPMFARVDVNGPNAHPLWRRLKAAAPGTLGVQAIKWNFTKFLVDRAGAVVARFGPRDTPEAIAPRVAALLQSGSAASTAA